jgi:cell division protein FtsN
MPRDYAARNRKPAAKPAGLPGWVWLVAGLSMGLIVACIVYIGRPTAPMPMAPAAGVTAQKGKAKSEIPPVEQPRFEFYGMLEEKDQVQVSGQPARPPKPPEAKPAAPVDAAAVATVPTKPAAPPTSAATSAGGERFIVLAGSFRDLGNAEQHKAKLALSGIEAHIDTVQLQEGGTVHRVRVGPAPRANAERTVALLQGQGFASQLIRQP